VQSIRLITVTKNEKGSEDVVATYRFCESTWKTNMHTKFLAADGSWQVSDFQMLESTITFFSAETCGISSCVDDRTAADRVPRNDKKTRWKDDDFTQQTNEK